MQVPTYSGDGRVPATVCGELDQGSLAGAIQHKSLYHNAKRRDRYFGRAAVLPLAKLTYGFFFVELSPGAFVDASLADPSFDWIDCALVRCP